MLDVIATVPGHNATGVFLDDGITITFSQAIEGSFVSNEFFTMYRTNSDGSIFYEQVSCDVISENETVAIRPAVVLQPQQYYMVLVLATVCGIDGSSLETNYYFIFRTGDTERPVSEDTDVVIRGVDLFIDGGLHEQDSIRPSTDLFIMSGDTATIALADSVPQNYAVGVDNLRRIVLIYNDAVYSEIAEDMISIRYSEVPIDPMPMTRHVVDVTSVTVQDNRVILAFDAITDMENREYVVTIPSYLVRGVTKRGYDYEERTIRFLGVLTPLYATPEQIVRRLTEWSDHFTLGISHYELYKLIHEKSLWVSAQGLSPSTTIDLIRVNRAVVCLVLRELLGASLFSGGGIKSRSLLMTAVEYNEFDFDKAKDELEKCIAESLPEISEYGTHIHTGIKSGTHIGRQGKNYGVYR